MREIGHTLSRLSQVRALLIGAAIIVGSFAAGAHGQESGSGKGLGEPTPDGLPADEAAPPVTQVFRDGTPALNPGVALPRPLSPGDAAVYWRIFALQEKSDSPEAARATANLRNPLLLGAVLADRFLGRYHRSTTAELLDWLDHYRDQPDAPAIRALLLTKLPQGTPPPAVPDVPSLPRSAALAPALDETDTPRNAMPPAAALDRQVVERAQHGQGNQVLRFIASIRTVSPACRARLRAEVAQVLFTRNEDADALRIIEDSLGTTAPGDQNSLTFYIGGLAAWRLGNIEQARRLFESGSSAEISSPRLRAATEFWASRANQRLHRAVATVKWLRRAADERTTFHGILARRMLRMQIGLVPDGQLLTEADVDAVAATPQGEQAFALLQVDQLRRAESELRALWPQIQANALFGRSVLLVASAAGLNDFAAQLADRLQAAEGHRFDALRFPIPRLRPAHGFRVDPALVYAMTRTESHFDSAAISPMGALGLMQIMPATARYIAADLGSADERLHNPSLNLEIGQRYVCYLARLDGIDDDLIRLLASYNSGPGNFLRWSGDIRDNGDPLLFIEAIPSPETRAFVPDVLAAAWIYAAELHRPAPSLDSLAAGDFPRFTPMPEPGRMTNVALSLK
ncbi:lytic transglycosylase domain-containing protein [Rhodopila sp.]|uniref:lytic transglycosylase domain-containing protein n=1 Tax=Rhodopila sp. TaxID=2480087 RepID=UPI003D115D3B